MAKRMAEQMELFEPVTRGFEEGGLMDEGGTVDPVSGNEVPPGSTQEEVRDDIPAQLSEGEFVFPADVVRYFGLEKLMKMRQEAKMGLKRMEEMGQMGNSEEATMPDDLPFSIEDLDMEDEEEYNKTQEFARGGVVYAQQGAFMNNTPSPDPQSGIYYQPSAPTTTGVAQAPIAAASAPAAPKSTYKPPQQAFTPVRPPQQLTPTFQGTVGFGPEGVEYETVTYVNEQGQTIVLKKNKQTGQLLDLAGNPATIPEGYKLKGEEEEVAPVTTETTQVTGQDDGGRDSDVSTEPTVSFGGTKATGRRAGLVDNAFSGKFSIEMPGVGILDTAQAMKGYLGSAASGLAYGLTGGKFGEQLSLKEGQFAVISDIKVPGTRATPLGQDRTLALDLVLDAETYNNMMRGNVSDRKEMEKVANFVDKYGENIVGSDDGRVRVNKALIDLVDRVEEAEKTGNVNASGRFINQFEENTRKSTGKGFFKDTSAAAEKARQDAASAAAEKARQDAAAAAARAAALDAEDRDNGRDDGGFDGSEGFGSGDDAAAPICLTEDMKVKRNGVIDFVTNVKVGDIVDNTVVTEVLHKHMREGYYVVNGELKITNDHPVLANGSWKRTEDLVLGDYINKVEVTSLEYVEQVTPTVYIGTADDRYDVYTEGEVYTVHGQYKNGIKKAA